MDLAFPPWNSRLDRPHGAIQAGDAVLSRRPNFSGPAGLAHRPNGAGGTLVAFFAGRTSEPRRAHGAGFPTLAGGALRPCLACWSCRTGGPWHAISPGRAVLEPHGDPQDLFGHVDEHRVESSRPHAPAIRWPRRAIAGSWLRLAPRSARAGVPIAGVRGGAPRRALRAMRQGRSSPLPDPKRLALAKRFRISRWTASRSPFGFASGCGSGFGAAGDGAAGAAGICAAALNGTTCC